MLKQKKVMAYASLASAVVGVSKVGFLADLSELSVIFFDQLVLACGFFDVLGFSHFLSGLFEALNLSVIEDGSILKLEDAIIQKDEMSHVQSDNDRIAIQKAIDVLVEDSSAYVGIDRRERVV